MAEETVGFAFFFFSSAVTGRIKEQIILFHFTF